MAEGDYQYQFFALTNIPPYFHAADLRAHFSSLVETGSFLCFHFRHRPEKVNSSGDDKSNKEDRKLCCVVKIVKNKFEEMMRYNNQNWTNVHGHILADQCHLSQIQLISRVECQDGMDAVEEDKLLQMPELNPPDLMPQGNVGTTTLVFLELIQQCLLPHNLINKLQLSFPKTAARRIYANVHLDYGTTDSHGHPRVVGEDRGRHTRSRRNMLIRKPIDRKEVCGELGAGIQHQFVAAGHLHSNHVQQSGNEKVVEGGGETESSSVETVADVDRVQGSNSELVVEGDINRVQSSSREEVVEGGEDRVQSSICEEVKEGDKHMCVNFKEYVSSAACRPHSVALKSVVTGSNPGLSSTRGFSGCTFSSSSDTFVQPEAPPEKEGQKLTNRQRRRMNKQQHLGIKQLKAENIEERLIAVESRYQNDDDAEEWDRHEASEDDPSNQERNKERLYEEEIEQPWEKGGPGVVFYTDAVFWQEREGDFDEQTTDDLDVDFSVYEGEGSGDKDIQDFLKIRQEKRYREGYDNTDRFSAGIGKPLPESTRFRSVSRLGAFESHSKGIGRKLMERQGWTDGQGLGRSMPGIVHALKGEGQLPSNKRGLGYTEAKPVVYASNGWKRSRYQAHLITTIFDNPQATDPKEPLLHRSEPSTLKHRQFHLNRFT